MLACFCCVVSGVRVMAVRDMGMVARLLVVSGSIMLGRGAMVLGGLLMMLGGFPVMLVAFRRHG